MGRQAKLVIIDGNNALNLMKRYSEDARSSFPEKREKLVTLVQNLAHMTHDRYTVVFDGFCPDGRTKKYGDMVKVIYSEGASADSVIEKMTFSAASPSMEIVSSDNAVRTVCRGRGASVLKIEEFEMKVELLLDRHSSEFVRQKGGREERATGDTLGEALDPAVRSKLARLAELKRREEELLEKKRREEQAAKKKNPPPADERSESELFLETIGGGVRRVTSKTVDFGLRSPKNGAPSKDGGKGGPKSGPQPAGRPGSTDGRKPHSDEDYDWTKHIDDSFGKGPGKKR